MDGALEAVGKYRSNKRAEIEAPLLNAAHRAMIAPDPVAALNPVLAGIAASFGTARLFPRYDALVRQPKPVEEYNIASALVWQHGYELANVAAVTTAVPLICQKLKAALRPDGTPYIRSTALSGVSKWVWFTSPQVGVIYDKRARGCMLRLGYRLLEGDYLLYCRVFQHLLREHLRELEEAGRQLSVIIGEAGFQLSRRAATRKALDLVLYWNPEPTGEVPEGAPLEDGDLFS